MFVPVWREHRMAVCFCVSSLSIPQMNVEGLYFAAAASVIFSVVAYMVRGVTRSGAIAGGCVCFLLYWAIGFRAVGVLFIVFALTWLTTRFGYRKKQKLGTAEERAGRSASQVVANLGVATACACVFKVSHRPEFLLAMAAAFAEAAADTVSSEFGQATRNNAYLITNWKQVPAGTNGGISLFGTVAGISAAAIVSSFCATSGLLSWRWAVFGTLAGIMGMLADSFLGALLEERRLLNNNAVNFLGTLCAAIASVALT
jgi:uncharacterized protein (TIGR00297 family)